MPNPVLHFIAGAALLGHGLGFGGAIAALAWIAARPGSDSGKWKPATSWLLRSMPSSTITKVASAIWVLSLAGFAIAALSFWRVLPVALWQPVGVVTALVSTVGIVLVAGTWPAFNTIAALAANIVIVVGVVLLGWPQAPFG